MARISKKLRDKHAEFREEYSDIWTVTYEERRQAVQDRRFYSLVGAMWEDEAGEQFANMPRFEANKINASMMHIFSEYRNNRITVDFIPKDTESSHETADNLKGRYRSDEQESTAQEAYDNTFEEGVGGGIGAWRLRVVYADDEEAEDYKGDDPETETRPLRIAIEPIYDADSSVFWDLDAKRYDKADAKRCYLLSSITRKSYERNPKYKKYPVSSVTPAKPNTTYFDWCTPDVIYLAEVYEVEVTDEKLHIYESEVEGADPQELDDDDIADADTMRDLAALGYFHARDKHVRRRQIHKYIMNGECIIDDCGYIAGKCIPIVPYYGKRWFIDNIERSMGHVRPGKDMQRLLNMVLSKLGEIAGRAPDEVPILTPEQVKGHQNSWARGNVDRKPYRLINAYKDAQGTPIPGSGQVPTLKPPDVPPVLATLAQVATGVLDQVMNSNPDQDSMVSNISAKAVELIQQRVDMKAFLYTDNFAKSMRRSGQIWLSIYKDICPDEEHDAAVLKPDGSQDFVKMMSYTMDKATGAKVPMNNPNVGRFGVWSDVGPSFNSRRDATVRAIMGILGVLQPSDQQLATVLISTAIMNTDGEGLSELRDFMRQKLLALGAVKPTEEEAQALAEAKANEKPDPNTVFLLAEAEKSQALGKKALADAYRSLAAAEQARATALNQSAQARKALAESHGVNVDSQLKTIQSINEAGAPPAVLQ